MTINRAPPHKKRKKKENMVAVSRPDGCCFAFLCAVRTRSRTKANRYWRNLLYRPMLRCFAGREQHKEKMD